MTKAPSEFPRCKGAEVSEGGVGGVGLDMLAASWGVVIEEVLTVVLYLCAPSETTDPKGDLWFC
ncbi:uncharacterized protein PHACADRAFT_259257 [Phanerochaete carnosa HHB-10118-sp]|uniref:Uncharacterized protein n=1 Tax=Phanerochaete carnosa (strain HHB-10118-sp) TaxID=650164 RepID=K5WRS3_PHACS|nr:uncharacterized protein PHACADRAFT_259257 [Phanerochaete carnosa HHB-10118-sp]EKM53092.1 hypothetical protein PHACADRAFT_259257 [Phanerochaete carnosa HHB-10118-sp]